MVNFVFYLFKVLRIYVKFEINILLVLFLWMFLFGRILFYYVKISILNNF